MAVVPRRGNDELSQREDQGVVIAANVSAERVQIGDAEVGRVGQQVITAKNTGKNTIVRNTMYSKTNFYIQQTHSYIPTRKLRTFINFPGFTKLIVTGFGAIFLLFIVTGGMIFILKPYLALALSGLVLFSSVAMFCIFCQHLHVIRGTIPWILRLPTLPDMPKGNAHIEVAITELEGVYRTAHNKGVGVVGKKSGKIELHILSTQSVEKVKKAIRWSITFFVWSVLLSLLSAGLIAFEIYWLTAHGINSCINEISQINNNIMCLPPQDV